MGASEHENRYSNLAIRMLLDAGHPVTAIGARKGTAHGIPILDSSSCEKISQIDTVTLYLNPQRQRDYYAFILRLKPKRVIFNPGTENTELQDKLDGNGIQWEEACTLVLLRSGQF